LYAEALHYSRELGDGYLVEFMTMKMKVELFQMIFGFC